MECLFAYFEPFARAKRGDPALALSILDCVRDVAPNGNDAPVARR
jgi:hypothetical protein